MLQSHHIELIGAAGVAFSNIGQVLLATGTGIDEEVTIHELAHQWAGYQVETPWMWEGLAEYGTQTLAPQLGIQTRDWEWQSFGYTDPIATWYNGSSVRNPYYWYGKSAAFWFEYEKAIGGRGNMSWVLSLMDDYEADWPLDGEWFMDRGRDQRREPGRPVPHLGLQQGHGCSAAREPARGPYGGRAVARPRSRARLGRLADGPPAEP
jgi:hypothetical protein